MNQRITLSAIASLLFLAGCASTAPTQIPQKIALSQANQGDPAQINETLFTQASLGTSQLIEANQQQPLLLNQLGYLRTFSYFGELDEVSESAQQQFNEAMVDLGDNLNANTPSLVEQWSVLVYRYYANEKFDAPLDDIFDTQIRLLGQFETTPITNIEQEYALWELIRSVGLLMHSTYREDSDNPLKQQLLASKLSDSLLKFASSDNAIINGDDWPLQNAYWALAMWQLNQEGDDWSQLEAKVTPIAKADITKRGDEAKQAFTLGYLVNGFYGQEACNEEYSDYCLMPTEEQILPIEHYCSDSLFIRTQDLSQQELAISCEKLTSQESNFHHLLNTHQQPVANDNNTALKVVVFKNWSQYNAYGQLLYDIGTDNGGMYIEGTPQAEVNQATFYAFRAWWLEPEFKVWNLNHEYVHYLDGRFIKYGGFGHFPNSLVWWAEGMAEYISKGNDNDKALRLAKETDKAEQPSLETIFATEYNDGLDRTYRWSYLAIRFLSEHDLEGLNRLGQRLKADDFGGYEAQMAKLAKQHQPQFEQWLATISSEVKDEQVQSDDGMLKPHKQNRYSYRDYLKPEHLSLDSSRLHF